MSAAQCRVLSPFVYGVMNTTFRKQPRTLKTEIHFRNQTFCNFYYKCSVNFGVNAILFYISKCIQIFQSLMDWFSQQLTFILLLMLQHSLSCYHQPLVSLLRDSQNRQYKGARSILCHITKLSIFKQWVSESFRELWKRKIM